MRSDRFALVLCLALLTGACAAPAEVYEAPPADTGRMVTWVYERADLAVGGVDEAERALQQRYVAAVESGADRHRAPKRPALFAEEREDVYRAWDDLRVHYREALLKDARAGRLASFRVRAQELAALAFQQLQESEADLVAKHWTVARYEPRDVVDTEALLVKGNFLARSEHLHHALTGPYSLGAVLKETTAETVFADDLKFERVSAGLAAALYRPRGWRFEVDQDFRSDLTHLRRRIQLRADAKRGTLQETAPIAAARADAAADEAERHRDRALDAALDGTVATESRR